jgi:HAD superfamily hydrolase (TIGR01509 family)
MAFPLEAVLFDLDGLLVDTEPYYYEAHRQVFAEHGYELSRREYALKWIIRGTRMDREAPGFGITADPNALLADVKKRFRAMAEAELKLMPHAREALEQANRRFITALVTNAPRQETEMIVRRLGLSDLLRHLVTREEYTNPKPSPDCYLAAARIVGVPAPGCLAIEDSSRGVRAALGAGVPCVAVLNEMTRYEPPEGALMTLQSLSELEFDSALLVSAFG